MALPEGIKAGPVRAALVADLLSVEPGLRRTLTWDRGREMADHAAFTEQTGCPVYFWDPKIPGIAARTTTSNRLLRQYLDKNGNISVHDQSNLDRIVAKLNGRPCHVLGWRTPAEVYGAFTDSRTDTATSRGSGDAESLPRSLR